MHPFQKHREGHVSRARVKHILKADGGEVDSPNMQRAKAALRGDMGVATRGSYINRTGVWTPKTGADAQEMADSIRGQRKDN